MKSTVKFKKLASLLRDQIVTGKYPVGSVIPSETQLIGQYGVSRTTVRDAINLLVDDGFLAKKRGRFSGTTVLERSKTSERLRKSINFGILGCEHIFDPLINDAPAVEYGIIAELMKWNATLSMFPFLSKTFSGALPFAKELIQRNLVDGFFLFRSTDLIEFYEYLQSIQFPFVFICAGELTIPLPKIPQVYIQELKSIEKFTENLKRKGFSRIHLLASEQDFGPSRTHEMFSEASRKAGIPYEVQDCSGFSFERFLASVKKVIRHDTAIVTSNLHVEKMDIAVELLHLQIPRDAYIVFFKHYSPDWTKYRDRYAVIDRPYHKLGIMAAKLMRELYEAKIAGRSIPCRTKLFSSECPMLKDIPKISTERQ